MLGSFHNVGSSLVLVVLHPALTKELPEEIKIFLNNQQIKTYQHSLCVFPTSQSAFFLFSVLCLCSWLCMPACVYSLVWDDLEDQVVQQCELLSYLQGRVALKRLSFTVLLCLRHRHKHTKGR